jgi:uncharacterized protein YbjT (DUF2867 family)
MSTAVPVTLVGATGLTGSATLAALLSGAAPSSITTVTRRPLAAPIAPASTATTYENRVLELEHDKTSTWGEISKAAGVFISCLGTTKAAAGSWENAHKVDVLLNQALAEKAKADGAQMVRSVLHYQINILTHRVQAIIISSGGASSSSRMPYLRHKGQFDDAIKAYGYEKVVILQPGLLLGERYVRRLKGRKV